MIDDDINDGPLADLPQHATRREIARYEALLAHEESMLGTNMEGGPSDATRLARMEGYRYEIGVRQAPSVRRGYCEHCSDSLRPGQACDCKRARAARRQG